MLDNVEKKNNSELTNTTADELLGLKKGLASEIVDKMLEKNPDLAPFFLKGSVTNYLVDDGSIKDYLRDEIIIKGLGESTGLLTITPTLEKIRNMFSKADTKSKLEKLKVDVFSELGFSEQSVSTEQVQSSTTDDVSIDKDASSEGRVADLAQNEDKSKYSINQLSESKFDNNLNSYANSKISESVVKKARDYISNGGTFHSNSKGTITWGRGKYKHVCSTGSYNVLWKLGLPKVSNSTECDLKGKILPKMGLEYIGEVDPDNPGKNGYKPQNGDTAVWPRFNNGKKMTQHQATFINGYRVSDTIQKKMSCYGSKNEPNVKVYRYTGKVSS